MLECDFIILIHSSLQPMYLLLIYFDILKRKVNNKTSNDCLQM